MIEIFGPGWGNYAIRGIVETSIPEQVSLRPTTPGWWILLTLLLGGAVYFAWTRWQRHLRDRYRRDAQAALDAIEANYRRGDRDCLRELAPLLRATVIEALGERDRVVRLRGAEWQRALQEMAPKLPPLPVSQLESLAYQSLNDVGPGLDSLFTQLRDWIAAHELPSA
ncbi:DUF4381 domain-containing protein [Congregibacter variabilis]|uniref:DUF4381 domain-containing protein n=1 Tax=Congregibacter variabilis TaxID=3081200 RepID=A0ABZ0I2A4_9GAMM|nr:DUF4381 domain-containing protein [Congregibacter sp. IMCC43200]